jgi:hypothetical protein
MSKPRRLSTFTDLMSPGECIASLDGQLKIGYSDGEAVYYDWSRCSGSPVSPKQALEAVGRTISGLNARVLELKRWRRVATSRKGEQ